MTSVDLAAIPFVEARWKHTGRLTRPRLLVVHTAENSESNQGAEGLANYFHNTAVQASVHFNVDNDSIVQSVDVLDTAFGAAGANADGVHTEFCGRAGQSVEEWDDDYSNGVLALGGALFRELGARLSIPLVRLTASQVAAGERGICGHADVYEAYRQGDYRWDPGPNFPWDEFMAHVTGSAPGVSPSNSVPQEDEPMLIGINSDREGDGRHHLVVLGRRGYPLSQATSDDLHSQGIPRIPLPGAVIYQWATAV